MRSIGSRLMTASTLLILVITCKPGAVAAGSPGELSSAR